MRKYIIILWVSVILFWWIIYANTNPMVRQYIDWRIGTGIYDNHSLTAWNGDTNSRLRLMRTWSESWEGDDLLGTYIDQAYGKFTFPDSWIDKVQITGDLYDWCDEWFYGRMLEGRATSEIFWPVSFDEVHICIPETQWQLGSVDNAIIWWFITSVDWMISRAEISITLSGSSFEIDGDVRGLKVIGLASSQNFTQIDAMQLDDIRVLGNISKFELQTLTRRNVANITRNLRWDIDESWEIRNLSWTWWWDSRLPWTKLINNSVTYFRDISTTWDVPRVTISWDDLDWNKTLVVEWSDIYIDWNITWDGILGIIALQRNGRWGNIYIDNNVTDVHAFIYTDRSLMSARMHNGDFQVLNGADHEERLFNQLYIKWVLFSENTIWGAHSTPYTCPFYIHQNCDLSLAAQYDLNYLRRYYMGEDEDGVPTPSWRQAAWIIGRESDLENYTTILEYDNRIMHTPPPLFTQ